MWRWQDGLQAWGAMTALGFLLLIAIATLALYAHDHVPAEDDADLVAKLRGE